MLPQDFLIGYEKTVRILIRGNITYLYGHYWQFEQYYAIMRATSKTLPHV